MIFDHAHFTAGPLYDKHPSHGWTQIVVRYDWSETNEAELAKGWIQRGENRPGPHMDWADWGQSMWLSDRDMAQAFEKAVTAPEDVRVDGPEERALIYRGGEAIEWKVAA